MRSVPHPAEPSLEILRLLSREDEVMVFAQPTVTGAFDHGLGEDTTPPHFWKHCDSQNDDLFFMLSD